MPKNVLLRRIAQSSMLAGLIALCAAPALGAPDKNPGSPPSIIGFWTGEKVVQQEGAHVEEDATYNNPADRQSLTPQVWNVLHEQRIPLYLHVRYGRDFGPVAPGTQSDALDVIRKANSLGIPVIAWIVLPYEQGYWAYQGNAAENFKAVKAWDAWTRKNHLAIASIALDQEFSWQNLKTYIPTAMTRDPQKLAALMTPNIDPAAQCKALATDRDLISWAHGRGIKVDAAEAPMVADDLDDGNMALQNGLQISGSLDGYDRTYLMAYRSAVNQAGFDPGTAYIAAYYRDMQKHFGKIGQVSLGIPGQAPYDTLAPIETDVRLLAGLGATAIPIYSLEEMVAKFGPEGIERLAEAARHPMSASEIAEASVPSRVVEGALAASKSKDAMATKLTETVTAARGHPQAPNAWPNPCGLTPPQPLKSSRQQR